jgi:hypothetical protein
VLAADRARALEALRHLRNGSRVRFTMVSGGRIHRIAQFSSADALLAYRPVVASDSDRM